MELGDGAGESWSWEELGLGLEFGRFGVGLELELGRAEVGVREKIGVVIGVREGWGWRCS